MLEISNLNREVGDHEQRIRVESSVCSLRRVWEALRACARWKLEEIWAPLIHLPIRPEQLGKAVSREEKELHRTAV
jgi:hypothetical protein